MSLHLKSIINIFILLALGIILLSIFLKLIAVPYLTFSDGAKFADIARSVINRSGYNGKFSFWSNDIIDLSQEPVFPSPWMPPLMPLLIAIFFKIFGVSDLSVIATSSTFFVLMIVFIYLLGNKVFGSIVGFVSAIIVLFNESFIRHATSGATEPLFAFEIVTAAYLLTLKKKWTTVLGFIFMILMYFTRPQAFIYIAGLILYWLLITFKYKKAFLYFIVTTIIGLLVDKFVLSPLAGKYYLYPILARGAHALSQVTAVSSPSDALRGVVQQANLLTSFKKIFYNLYNLYKLLPQIASPYLLALFFIGLFHWTKNKIYNAFKASAIFMIGLTFLITAISIPLFRYVHPAIPLVYLIAVETLIWVIGKIADEMISGYKNKFVGMVSAVLIFVFCIGQTLGVIFLDSRFNSRLVNRDKPPVYVTLSRILKENTNPNQLILTNLDTWGSWYGDRRTVWYPVKPDIIIPPEGKENPLEVIYLTSYLMDDENYYMGEDWRQIFLNPKNIQNKYISENYKLKASFDIKAEDIYENYSAHAVLLIRK